MKNNVLPHLYFDKNNYFCIAKLKKYRYNGGNI